MTKKLTTLLATGALVLGLQQAQAAQITGSIDMSGTATLDNVSLGSATKATSFSAVTVGGTPTGSFTGTSGNSASWNAFTFGSSADVTPLWTFTDAGTGWTYTFDLDSNTIVSQDNFFLNLRGSGVLDITGAGSPYVPTTGAWSFTISNSTGGDHANFQFTFANSQTAVPDGGATALLLGLGFLGLGFIARRK